MAAAAICKWLHGGPKRLGKESKGVGPHRDPSPSRGEGGSLFTLTFTFMTQPWGPD